MFVRLFLRVSRPFAPLLLTFATANKPVSKQARLVRYLASSPRSLGPALNLDQQKIFIFSRRTVFEAKPARLLFHRQKILAEKIELIYKVSEVPFLRVSNCV